MSITSEKGQERQDFSQEMKALKTLNRPSKHLDNENFVEESKNKLTKAGIKATKYHYSKMESKQCTVRVSKDLKKLKWRYEDASKYQIFAKRECLIEEIQSVIYGPLTHTFRAYRLQNIMAI